MKAHREKTLVALLCLIDTSLMLIRKDPHVVSAREQEPITESPVASAVTDEPQRFSNPGALPLAANLRENYAHVHLSRTRLGGNFDADP